MKIVDWSKYKPTHVKFKYKHNNASDGWFEIPAPSESALEAVLYFDSAQFNYLKIKYFSVSDSVQNCINERFNFGWLDKEIQKEFLNVDTTCIKKVHFFKLGFDKTLWLFKNKILIFELRT